MWPAARVRRPLQIHASPDAVRPMHGTVEQYRNLTGGMSGREKSFRLGYLAGRGLCRFQNSSLASAQGSHSGRAKTYAQGNFEWK
jgi:hypothetical protein